MLIIIKSIRSTTQKCQWFRIILKKKNTRYWTKDPLASSKSWQTILYYLSDSQVLSVILMTLTCKKLKPWFYIITIARELLSFNSHPSLFFFFFLTPSYHHFLCSFAFINPTPRFLIAFALQSISFLACLFLVSLLEPMLL